MLYLTAQKNCVIQFNVKGMPSKEVEIYQKNVTAGTKIKSNVLLKGCIHKNAHVMKFGSEFSAEDALAIFPAANRIGVIYFVTCSRV